METLQHNRHVTTYMTCLADFLSRETYTLGACGHGLQREPLSHWDIINNRVFWRSTLGRDSHSSILGQAMFGAVPAGMSLANCRRRLLLAPQPSHEPCQEQNSQWDTPGVTAQPWPASGGWGVTVSGLLRWCRRLLKHLEPAWSVHSSWAWDTSNQTPPRNSPSVILMASENQHPLQSTASCRKAVQYVPWCWYMSLSLPGAWKEQSALQGCTGLPRSLMVRQSWPSQVGFGTGF